MLSLDFYTSRLKTGLLISVIGWWLFIHKPLRRPRTENLPHESIQMIEKPNCQINLLRNSSVAVNTELRLAATIDPNVEAIITPIARTTVGAIAGIQEFNVGDFSNG